MLSLNGILKTYQSSHRKAFFMMRKSLFSIAIKAIPPHETCFMEWQKSPFRIKTIAETQYKFLFITL